MIEACSNCKFSKPVKYDNWFNTPIDVNKLKAMEKDVMCHRFPATVQKRKTDVCGEWKV